MKILAIDPGYERLGIAIVEKINSKEIVLYSECFKTSAKLTFGERLALLGEKIEDIIKTFTPQALAIEKLYLSVNQKTAMNVAEARGVMVYEAAKAGLAIFEYTPLEIKIAVAGHGRATKEEVIKMAKKLVVVRDGALLDDELDAIAIGLTCFARERFK